MKRLLGLLVVLLLALPAVAQDDRDEDWLEGHD